MPRRSTAGKCQPRRVPKCRWRQDPMAKPAPSAVAPGEPRSAAAYAPGCLWSLLALPYPPVASPAGSFNAFGAMRAQLSLGGSVAHRSKYNPHAAGGIGQTFTSALAPRCSTPSNISSHTSTFRLRGVPHLYFPKTKSCSKEAHRRSTKYGENRLVCLPFRQAQSTA